MKGNVVRKGLRILLNRGSDVGGRIDRSIVSEASAVARHLVDGRPALLAQVVRGDFQGVSGVIDELEETLHAFLVEYQLAVLIVVAAAERLHDVRKSLPAPGRWDRPQVQTPAFFTSAQSCTKSSQVNSPAATLRRKSLGFFHGPAVVHQHLLVVVDDADRQVKRHGIRHTIHAERN